MKIRKIFISDNKWEIKTDQELWREIYYFFSSDMNLLIDSDDLIRVG